MHALLLIVNYVHRPLNSIFYAGLVEFMKAAWNWIKARPRRWSLLLAPFKGLCEDAMALSQVLTLCSCILYVVLTLIRAKHTYKGHPTDTFWAKLFVTSAFLVVGLLFIGNPTIGKNSWLSTEYGTQEQTILSPSRALTDASRSATGVRGSSLKQLLETYLVPLLPPTSSYKQYTVKKYHLCMLTITRNEHWLLEFLVRNILAGVTHIVLIDDNRVRRTIDVAASYSVSSKFSPLQPWREPQQERRGLTDQRLISGRIEYAFSFTYTAIF